MILTNIHNRHSQSLQLYRHAHCEYYNSGNSLCIFWSESRKVSGRKKVNIAQWSWEQRSSNYKDKQSHVDTLSCKGMISIHHKQNCGSKKNTKWKRYFLHVCMYVCLFFNLHFWRVTHRTHKLELLYTLVILAWNIFNWTFCFKSLLRNVCFLSTLYRGVFYPNYTCNKWYDWS